MLWFDPMFASIRKEFSSGVHTDARRWIVLFLACACSAYASDSAELQDAAARVQYAYYTRDLRALRTGLGDLERMDLAQEARSQREYQLGIGHWWLAELTQATGRNEVSQALRHCEEHLDVAIRLDPQLTDAQAVRGLCSFQRGDPRAMNPRTLKRECGRQNAVAKAVEAAPRNARVLYVEALCAMTDGDVAKALDRAQRAWSAFQAPLGGTDEAAWGQAETSLLLGQAHLRQGNRAAARDWVERALIVAPDYVAARELLAQIATGK